MSGGGYRTPEPSGGLSDCARLSFRTSLASVDRALLSTVTVGEVFDVMLIGDAAPYQTIEVLSRSTAQRLGAVTSQWQQLRSCLRSGYEFEAELVSVAGPVTVLIRPKSS